MTDKFRASAHAVSDHHMSHRKTDGDLQALMDCATLSAMADDRGAAQNRLAIYLVENPEVVSVVAEYYAEQLKANKTRPAFGFQETFPIIFTRANKDLITEDMMADMVYIRSKNPSRFVQGGACTNISLAFEYQSDLQEMSASGPKGTSIGDRKAKKISRKVAVLTR